jgi:hypothetical protein
MDLSKPGCRVLSENGAQCVHPAVGNSDYCWLHGDWFTADLEVFKMVDQHFRDDLGKFWQRSNFYLLAEAPLFSALASIAQAKGAIVARL